MIGSRGVFQAFEMPFDSFRVYNCYDIYLEKCRFFLLTVKGLSYECVINCETYF